MWVIPIEIYPHSFSSWKNPKRLQTWATLVKTKECRHLLPPTLPSNALSAFVCALSSVSLYRHTHTHTHIYQIMGYTFAVTLSTYNKFMYLYMCVHLLSRVWLFATGMDCSPPGFPVHGIFQARILEWVPFPPPEDLPNPGTEPSFLHLLHWKVDSLPLSHLGSPL